VVSFFFFSEKRKKVVSYIRYIIYTHICVKEGSSCPLFHVETRESFKKKEERRPVLAFRKVCQPFQKKKKGVSEIKRPQVELQRPL
jgi:hypothetical protein